ncbi:MAG: hypothetical protein WC455_28870, partial [Dehalococcoidia bacterium]
IAVVVLSEIALAQPIGPGGIYGGGGSSGSASTSAAGIAELATDEETVTGSATDKVTTPANLTAKLAAPGAIGETTPGTIRSLIKEIVKTASGNLAAAEVSGTIINNYGQTEDATLALPTAASGMSFMVVCGTTVAKFMRLDPAGTDLIYLDGVAGTDGKYVGIASAAVGAAISFVAIQTGESAYDWVATSISGTWAAE